MEETTADKPVKYCLECGNPIGASREDKKYCSNECRTAYNNERRKKDKPGSVAEPVDRLAAHPNFKRVYEVLIKNRELLYWHYHYFGDTLPLRDLLGRGFNLKYFTSIYTDENGFAHRCCFDYGYYVGTGEKVYIIERPEEIT